MNRQRKEILQYATTYISLKNIMLSEISQSQKHIYDSTNIEASYMRYLRIVKFIETE